MSGARGGEGTGSAIRTTHSWRATRRSHRVPGSLMGER